MIALPVLWLACPLGLRKMHNMCHGMYASILQQLRRTRYWTAQMHSDDLVKLDYEHGLHELVITANWK